MKTYTFGQIKEREHRGALLILFKLKGFEYQFRILKPGTLPYNKGRYAVRSLEHNDDVTCPYCCRNERYLLTCKVLQLDEKNIFEQLISVNHLRLTWLFREFIWKQEVEN